MTTIVIEKGIPAPAARGKYPFAQMEVGDSFFVPGKTSRNFPLGPYNARLGFGFRARTVTVDGVTGVRIWRVS